MNRDLKKLERECPNVYIPPVLNNTDIIALYDYYPWHNNKNPEINFVTFKMLNLKKKGDGKEAYARGHSVDFFTTALKKSILPLVQASGSDNVVCIVPSHEKDILSSGLLEMLNKLIKEFGFTNTNNLLRRTKTVESAHGGGDRSKQHHLDSIEAIYTDQFINKTVFLFDDVTSTGHSLNACKKILLNAGATEVIMIALGQTR